MTQLTYFTVAGTWEPSSTAGTIHGDVSFTMLTVNNGVLTVPTFDVIVVPVVTHAAIVDNTLGSVSLLANTAPLNLTGTLYYRADFSNVWYQEPGEPSARVTLMSVTFAASTDSTPIDMVNVTPAAGVAASQIESVTAANISDATALGRQLITAANTAAALADLGITTGGGTIALAPTSSAPAVSGEGQFYVALDGSLHYLSPNNTDTQIAPA